MWAEFAFKKPLLANQVFVYPKLEYGVDRDFVVKIKFKFIGYEYLDTPLVTEISEGLVKKFWNYFINRSNINIF